MDAPQAIFEFPGLSESWQSVSYTLSHGISPGVFTIKAVPKPGKKFERGDVTLTYDNTEILFRDCKIDSAALGITASGNLWTIKILDRRWKWEHKPIVGHYNQRDEGGKIDPDTEKTPQELAKLLLDAMGERRYMVGDLPNDARPQKDWSYAGAAQELASLCDALGCRVVLGTDNRVRIRKIGEGEPLPENGLEMNPSFNFDAPEKPESLLFVGGPTVYEAKWTLEAVGLDTDGDVKLIADLSYNPSGEGEENGWQTEVPGFFTSLDDGEQLKLAQESVYRWYRIKEHVDGTMEIPGYGEIEDIDQVLPLRERLVIDDAMKALGITEGPPAEVSGVFYSEEWNDANSENGTLYPGDYTLDTERGIVKFAEPVYRTVDDPPEGAASENNEYAVYRPAQLDLLCTFHVTDADTLEPDRFTRERNIGGAPGSGPQIVKRKEVFKTSKPTYTDVDEWNEDDIQTNLRVDELEEQADYYLRAAEAEYQATEAVDLQYAGILDIEPDGAIQQVTWSIGSNGATTRASRNSEHSVYVPEYRKRRRQETLKAITEEWV